MGNCLFGGGSGQIQGKIKVITANGGIMELGSPITVGCIADEFPGYGIFRSHDLFWNPLPHQEELVPGNVPEAAAMAPYRMSLDYQGILKRSQTEVFSRSGEIWKVKLVISPKRLVEILEEEGHTQELIESVRTVAKCGTTTTSSFSSMPFSDHWSLSTNATPSSSSKNGAFLG
ncbi:uncharacterized protein LOC111008316 [Momordica charantia]|uniref:Uncharacterized protein LOC111008316 n=1 Tax=Momordica charantia TaxID=3673 RepID=A0A6J1C4Y8_MOMCH|nr:uncharacterized protein LOC111008316 [Momordica charantia]